MASTFWVTPVDEVTFNSTRFGARLSSTSSSHDTRGLFGERSSGSTCVTVNTGGPHGSARDSLFSMARQVSSSCLPVCWSPTLRASRRAGSLLCLRNFARRKRLWFVLHLEDEGLRRLHLHFQSLVADSVCLTSTERGSLVTAPPFRTVLLGYLASTRYLAPL